MPGGGPARGEGCKLLLMGPPFVMGDLSPMARRGFEITGSDMSMPSHVLIPVGHEGVDGGDPVVTYCSCVWTDSVVGAKTGTLRGLGAMQEGRALWPWLGPAGLWPRAARLRSYGLAFVEGYCLPASHPHTNPSPTWPASEGQEDRMEGIGTKTARASAGVNK